MPLVVGGFFLALLIALVVVYKILSQPSGIYGQTVGNDIRCNSGEMLQTHYHAHLTILYKGAPVTVPAQIGIPSGCFYFMHTHDDSGAIHIEAPASDVNKQFTLGDFFAVWGQPLSSTQVATLPRLGQGDQLKVWVDGKPYTGDPSKIVLKPHGQVVLEIGPPFTDPPPTYTFDPSL
jgi:hypothetical protein